MKCKVILTWSGTGKTFCYEGSVTSGTTIRYGHNFQWVATISASDYRRIIVRFANREVEIGTSKDKPKPGSVGHWVKAHINKSGLMSYIGAILVSEGYASKPRAGWITFI